MLKVLKLSFALMCLFLSSQSIAAKYFDGNQVLRMCDTQSPEMVAGCAMFIVGAAESIRMVGYSDAKYCLPQDMSNQQLRQEFVSYLAQHTDALNYSAASLFMANLIENYPCKQQ